ncbi:helix-turn-helix domain-containing protein [Sporolactobacillus nakayamae]|uniref:Helix-turn-helix n=1 Tax=Sporolactobacillus nakayamae TaxID=269670 RepID=A0A1I2VF82_9BACL|nr:helix-turn-helix transcriptional regulator [Sporolactobacillus nakayamae]SFG87089.1 Helix-turn-helix [Sporolactobacillus nakayamae]
MGKINIYLRTVDFKEKLQTLYERLKGEEPSPFFGHTLSRSRLSNFETSFSRQNKKQKTLIEMLNEHLAAKEMTQQQLAMRSYLTKGYISNIFNRRINPSKSKLFQIALALELSLEETARLLKTRGFLLNDSDDGDKVIIACIENQEYDLDNVHDLMEEYAHIEFL